MPSTKRKIYVNVPCVEFPLRVMATGGPGLRIVRLAVHAGRHLVWKGWDLPLKFELEEHDLCALPPETPLVFCFTIRDAAACLSEWAPIELTEHIQSFAGATRIQGLCSCYFYCCFFLTT